MAFARVTACALVVVALASCRTVPHQGPTEGAVMGPGADAPWPEQRAALATFDRYSLDGRVAVAANGQGFSASLRYAQLARRTELSLEGPLGIGGLQVKVDGDDLEIATSRGERLDGAEARAELERRLGFVLPLEQLRWWMLGIPAPGDSAVNTGEGGEIRDFMQAGWRVSINSRSPGLGFSLPQRLTAEREGARLKLLVERWKP
jgi:outer membrane lipoprotein LolB